MAKLEPEQRTEMVKDTEEKLKYLDFVQVVAIYEVVCFSSVYRYAKENSGPLKPGVRTVEDTVRTVIGPVCDKFHDVPFQHLKFVDHKVHLAAAKNLDTCKFNPTPTFSTHILYKARRKWGRWQWIQQVAEIPQVLFQSICPFFVSSELEFNTQYTYINGL